jgi:putative transposase
MKVAQRSSELLTSDVAERLRRLHYHFQRFPIYFVTACTNERRRILSEAAIHARLMEFGKKGPDHGAWLGAYVLMPDHLHAFVVIDDRKLPLFTWMKSLKNTLSAVLRQKQIPSPHWQKGFFDHILRNRESYSAKWHYVRENPARAGLVADWRAWPFLGQIFDLEFRNDRF